MSLSESAGWRCILKPRNFQVIVIKKDWMGPSQGTFKSWIALGKIPGSRIMARKYKNSRSTVQEMAKSRPRLSVKFTDHDNKMLNFTDRGTKNRQITVHWIWKMLTQKIKNRKITIIHDLDNFQKDTFSVHSYFTFGILKNTTYWYHFLSLSAIICCTKKRRKKAFPAARVRFFLATRNGGNIVIFFFGPR